jgi:hypothetical protein
MKDRQGGWMADLTEIIRHWAATREQVPEAQIVNVEYDFDSGWGGSADTPGDPPTAIVRYQVVRSVLCEYPVDAMGDFIMELAGVYREQNWPTQIKLANDE